MPALPITDYFRDNVLVKRPYIRLEWCEAAVRDPIRRKYSRMAVASDTGSGLMPWSVLPITRQFSVRLVKALLICLVFLDPRPSKLAAVRYTCVW